MSELRSTAYWVGHAFTIIATIAGVFLAASAGLSTAVKLEMIQADRSTYYVSSSIYNELKSNVEQLDEFIELFDKRQFSDKVAATVRFNDYVLQTAKYSESTLEIEPSILADVSNYYFNVQGYLDSYKHHNLNHASMMLNIKNATLALKEKLVLKRFSAYNKALADSLESRGITTSQPNF